MHHRFSNLILKSKRSINRWRKCNNICIPKKPGCIEYDKFRNIHIYECDLNAMLAIKWRNAIKQAEEEKKINESQFGSRRHKSSQLPILIEILQQDYSRVARTSYGQINYDAKACYDCILPNIAFVSQRILWSTQQCHPNSSRYITTYAISRYYCRFKERMEIHEHIEYLNLWHRTRIR